MEWIGRTMICLCVLGIAQLAAGADDPDREGGRRDRDSHGNPQQIRVRRVELDLTVDFESKQLRGTATLDVERRPGCPAGTPLILDTRALAIDSVKAGGEEIRFEVGASDPMHGAPLTIHLPDSTSQLRIAYRTSPQASALQWVEPAQTAGGKRPFLFTQSEAIHARSWIPLQDSPGVRVTYAATIRVPPGFEAVMSADRRPKGDEPGVLAFEMPQAIPSYLIALAVGDLAFRPLGRRTGVYAEPSVVEKAAYEFADTEKMVEAAERLYGPYRWGRYDILVLPPSFPFGGMENPKLTVATPTVLAGDRSLVALVAHELAHSWAGNLVTNATWRNFWLNEGITTYIERRIVEELYGPDRAAMEAVLGLQELREELKRLPPGDQVLDIDLAGRDPDEAMTQVPYEKGALLLTTLEHAFGRARFDAFLRSYFDNFAFRSITTADFASFVRERLFAAAPKAAEGIDLDAWLEQPGLPAGFPEPHSEKLAEVEKQARRWLDGGLSAKDLPAASWTTQEWLRFLRALPESLSAAKLAELDDAFHLTDRGNAEIAQQWLLMAIRAGYKPADARLEQFLTSIGRRKYLMPLYGEMAKTPEGKARAEAIYARARPTYHPIAIDSVDRLLGRK
jgi:leukotriene A-4 hydrolase/aminopeptidase